MYYEEEQVSLFAPDSVSGRMSPALCRQTEEKISKPSSQNSSESQTQTLQPFLFLQKGSGTNGEDMWEPDSTVGGLLPLGYMTRNSMVFHSEDAESVLSLTTADGQHTGYCLTLNTGEKPRKPIPSKLSQILQKNPPPKYKLSAQACQGILNRAQRRGKALPPALEAALVAQSASKSEPENPEEEKESSSSMNTQELSAPSQTNSLSTICLEGNGSRESHFGNGWRVSDQMYTLNTTEQHAVAYGISPFDSNAMKSPNPNAGIYEADTSRTLDLNGGTPACNQGGMAIVEPTVLESNQNHATVTNSGVCPTLPASMGMGGGYVPMVTEPTCYNGECITSPTNKANPQPGDPCHTLTDDTRNYIVQVACFKQGNGAKARSIGYEEEKAPALMASDSGTNQVPAVYDARGNGNGETVNTLTGDHQDRITDYTAICIEGNREYMATDSTAYSMQRIGEYKESDAAFSLKMRDYKDATDLITTAVDCRNGVESETTNGTLQAKSNGGYNMNSNNICRSGAVVRRLTPGECELLQGFPTNWTRIGEPRDVEVNDYRYFYDDDGNEVNKEFIGTHTETEYFYTDENGKPKRLADSARYKALGNSCALPFWEWLDGRISSEYVGSCTLGSLFDGIGAFSLAHARHNGPKSVRFSSEIEPYPIAVTKSHFGDEDAGIDGDINEYLWR